MNASNQQAARLELQKRGIPFSSDCFVKCVEKHNEDVVRLFIEAGIDVNAPNSEGFTALMKAAHIGFLPMVSLLASCRGADVNRKGLAGWTPLMMAAQKGATDIVCFLVGRDPLSICISGKLADVTVKNDAGEMALMIARKFGAPQELIDCLESISKP